MSGRARVELFDSKGSPTCMENILVMMEITGWMQEDQNYKDRSRKCLLTVQNRLISLLQ